MRLMQTYNLPVIVERDEDGYFVYCPSLEGCYTQGNTYEEALKNIQEVMELCLEDDASRHNLPQTTFTSFVTMDVTV